MLILLVGCLLISDGFASCGWVGFVGLLVAGFVEDDCLVLLFGDYALVCNSVCCACVLLFVSIDFGFSWCVVLFVFVSLTLCLCLSCFAVC